MKKQVATWADKTQVEVDVDFITSTGKKINLTAAEESQAGTGHDFMQLYNWDIGNYADKLEPVDDVVKELSGQYGSYGAISEYLAKTNTHWSAVPSSTGTLNLTTCGRISLLKNIAGIDLLKMCPGGAGGSETVRRLELRRVPARRRALPESRRSVWFRSRID